MHLKCSFCVAVAPLYMRLCLFAMVSMIPGQLQWHVGAPVMGHVMFAIRNGKLSSHRRRRCTGRTARRRKVFLKLLWYLEPPERWPWARGVCVWPCRVRAARNDWGLSTPESCPQTAFLHHRAPTSLAPTPPFPMRLGGQTPPFEGRPSESTTARTPSARPRSMECVASGTTPPNRTLSNSRPRSLPCVPCWWHRSRSARNGAQTPVRGRSELRPPRSPYFYKLTK